MSIQISYLPSADNDKVIWLNNFSAKINTYASLMGITSAEVTNVQKDASMFQYIMNLLEIYKQTLNNLTSYKNLMKKPVAQQHLGAIPALPVLTTPPAGVSEGIFSRIAALVKRIKSSVNYTDSIGQDLGIIAPVQSVDLNALQPELTIKLNADRPHIKSSKSIADAIDLYVDRKDGNGFVLLNRLIKPDYIDTTNLPPNTLLAEWEYKARFVIGNDSVGLMSPVVSVIVKKI